ncbi:hypothetical protein ACFE04_004168 [Oxalis oulophora]
MTSEEEEKVIENELELQLQEQRESLIAINEALASDPSNSDLLSVQEELVDAIKHAEESLLYLKRARLLRQADSVLQNSNCSAQNEVKAPTVVPQPFWIEDELEEELDFPVGSKCRFRYTDGRWYNGQIVELETSQNTAKISFLTPTSENMLMCKFFLQQRCHFGNNCRFSHGIDVPLSSLKKFVPSTWEQALVGSTIWAVSDSELGIWRRAELESWNNDIKIGQVVFRDDGSSSKLGVEAIALSQYAEISSEEEEMDSSSDESDSSDDIEEEVLQGLGFFESIVQQKGIQTETAIFAKWENHTRGIASKMMANMGYREGMGLGASGQGMLNPIPVKVLPAKLSLDHAVQEKVSKESGVNPAKKRSRGGKRKREKKFAAAARAKKEESRPDVFSLINKQLAMSGGSGKKKETTAKGSKVDRRALIAYDDKVKELNLQVAKLEEMAKRNIKEKVVYEAATRKLNETRKALAEAEAAQSSASNSVVSKEKEKRWLKF